MPPARTLLAATDFSAPARHAAERAALIAQAHPDSRLTLAHVISSSALARLRHMLAGEGGQFETELLVQTERNLADLAANLVSRFDARIDLELLQGSALTTLAELAESRNADLLVMGARGTHFVREVLLGSTTERVLRKSRRPLLAVKQRAQTPYRRILAPIDFSAHAAAAVSTAHTWFPDADIVLLHAFEVEFESTLQLAGMDEGRIHEYRIQARDAAIAEMEAFVARLDVPPARLTRQFVRGAPTLRIIEHEQTIDADLVVMGKHGQSVMEELLLGSVTKHVLAHSTSDVFIASQPA